MSMMGPYTRIDTCVYIIDWCSHSIECEAWGSNVKSIPRVCTLVARIVQCSSRVFLVCIL